MKLIIYRVFSFLLLPVAILFAMSFMILIRAAFDNPPLFIPLFLVGSVAIYTFASLNFLIRGIDGKKFLGRSSKDWLIVNAIVSVIYSLLAIAQRILLFFNSSAIEDVASNFKKNGGTDLKASQAQIVQYVNGISYFLLLYGIVLFAHIILSFQYIKTYNYLFQNEKQ